MLEINNKQENITGGEKTDRDSSLEQPVNVCATQGNVLQGDSMCPLSSAFPPGLLLLRASPAEIVWLHKTRKRDLGR